MIISSVFDPAVIATSLFSATVFGLWFTFWYKTNLARTERERAYICTLLSSSITSLSSLPLVYTLLTNNGQLSEILVYRTWTVIVTAFFMTFLITDLVIGSIFYRNKVELLTGWIHHITYLCVLTWAIAQQYTAIFIMMCSLELPTFILAIGSVRSYLRRDYLFATTFLLTRIVFHGYAIWTAYKMETFGPVMLALSAFFPVHCFWFYGFIKQQIRLASERKVKKLSPATEFPAKDVTNHQNDQKPNVIQSAIAMKSRIMTSPGNKRSFQGKKINDNYNSYISSSFHQPQSPPVSVH